MIKKPLGLMLLTSISLFTFVGCKSNVIDISDSMMITNDSVVNLVSELSGDLASSMSASITSNVLNIESEGKSELIDLSSEDFFVSIAPYENYTHPWVNHILTGCKGELHNEDFDVIIEDKAGKVILNETVNSGDNGFIDFWLPRNSEFELTIRHKDKASKTSISTFNGDPTCITDIHLKK